MPEFKVIEHGNHNGKHWRILQAVKHPFKQLENDYFFQWSDKDPRWIPNIEGRAIGIKLGEYPAECAKYFLSA